MAGRALIRFLNAAIRHNYVEHIVVLHTEITFVQYVTYYTSYAPSD